jgi:hypothetical protein
MGTLFWSAFSVQKLIDCLLSIGLVVSAGLAISPKW